MSIYSLENLLHYVACVRREPNTPETLHFVTCPTPVYHSHLYTHQNVDRNLGSLGRYRYDLRSSFGVSVSNMETEKNRARKIATHKAEDYKTKVVESANIVGHHARAFEADIPITMDICVSCASSPSSHTALTEDPANLRETCIDFRGYH